MALPQTICSPLKLRMRVVFRPICSTVPATSLNTTKSPISKGLSKPMESEAKTSLRMVWIASAMAIPPTPRLATSAVILTPTFARIDNSITDQTTARNISPVITSVTGFLFIPG
ncbi:hypothetical protein D3C73_1367620 [compost metagenome]